MSAGTSPKAGIPLIDRLPHDRRNELIMIGREALCRFAYAYQQVFDEHLGLFDYLAARGATAVVIAKMLAEVGIAREDGSPLPAGTVSSALSRARERAALRPATPLHSPAVPCMDMQAPARTSSALHRPADAETSGSLRQTPAFPTKLRPSTTTQQFPEIRPSPNSPPTTTVPAETSRAAALLEQLRSKKDDD